MTNDVTHTADKTPAETPETTTGRRIYGPLTDIVETADGVTLMLEMPGVAAEDVDITLENRALTIRGKVHAAQPEKLQLAYAEYGEGDFERAFTMSDDFDPDKIGAQVSNGVLTLTLPRAAEAKPKKITVTAS
ncbi:Hsp20/alpha crystallin family protein [Salipiger aestuarii]|uniref:HSP20 family molecular chaperone IbpA n=1 Tax=Salipiger aestuarii TaxID=568098 RepID=A0A327Y408_9RHOB|nr:Hsp20/alpha crystallin family protein [Salipiger aestuarii]EIE50297.1 putative molecular chaperone small heat shock protein, hsp20 family [Citreicella sp. 357]KAA8609194.1 heat-shock protein Hsp20 [Salipiger aestuarii]KAB2541244.1 heat-shock protein Hsp20 [Salipiger aestuarii]RAK15121.1 HSP20 family molecular chaperone IbpA [Salipiger aestuarii]